GTAAARSLLYFVGWRTASKLVSVRQTLSHVRPATGSWVGVLYLPGSARLRYANGGNPSEAERSNASGRFLAGGMNCWFLQLLGRRVAGTLLRLPKSKGLPRRKMRSSASRSSGPTSLGRKR